MISAIPKVKPPFGFLRVLYLPPAVDAGGCYKETKMSQLIDGGHYKFKYNGYSCSGTYLKPEDPTSFGSFYNLGKKVCYSYQAVGIEQLFTESCVRAKLSKELSDSIIVVDLAGNTVDCELREGVLELQEPVQDVEPSKGLMSLIEEAILVVVNRDGDVDTEDGSFATTGTDEMIRLEAAIQNMFGLEAAEISQSLNAQRIIKSRIATAIKGLAE